MQDTDSIRDSANQSIRKGNWEAAETFLSKLVQLGVPQHEIASDLVRCIVNAHETLSEPDRARIEVILGELVRSGHSDLSAQIRAERAARLNPPAKKPWWKIW